MTSDKTDFFEEKGWHLGATLQRFKTFKFVAKNSINTFMLRLFEIEFPVEIHMQVTPKRMYNEVEVFLGYNPENENDARQLLVDIENIYKHFINEDI